MTKENGLDPRRGALISRIQRQGLLVEKERRLDSGLGRLGRLERLVRLVQQLEDAPLVLRPLRLGERLLA